MMSSLPLNKNKRIVKDNFNVQYKEIKTVLDIKVERPKKALSFLPLNKNVKMSISSSILNIHQQSPHSSLFIHRYRNIYYI